MYTLSLASISSVRREILLQPVLIATIPLQTVTIAKNKGADLRSIYSQTSIQMIKLCKLQAMPTLEESRSVPN